MTLRPWADNGWLRPHAPSVVEIDALLAIVDRDLTDAAKDLSADWQFGIAYNAVLKLCTILLYAEGYRPERNLQHYRTIQALPLIMGDIRKKDADYLETCRRKRNAAEYDYAGGIAREEAEELIAFVREFRQDVREWMKRRHPHLLKT